MSEIKFDGVTFTGLSAYMDSYDGYVIDIHKVTGRRAIYWTCILEDTHDDNMFGVLAVKADTRLEATEKALNYLSGLYSMSDIRVAYVTRGLSFDVKYLNDSLEQDNSKCLVA